MQSLDVEVSIIRRRLHVEEDASQILLQDYGTHFEFAHVGADSSQLRGLALSEQLKKTFPSEIACIQ